MRIGDRVRIKEYSAAWNIFIERRGLVFTVRASGFGATGDTWLEFHDGSGLYAEDCELVFNTCIMSEEQKGPHAKENMRPSS